MAWKELIFLVLFLASFLQVECRLDHEHEHDEALIASGNVTTTGKFLFISCFFICDYDSHSCAGSQYILYRYVRKLEHIEQKA